MAVLTIQARQPAPDDLRMQGPTIDSVRRRFAYGRWVTIASDLQAILLGRNGEVVYRASVKYERDGDLCEIVIPPGDAMDIFAVSLEWTPGPTQYQRLDSPISKGAAESVSIQFMRHW